MTKPLAFSTGLALGAFGVGCSPQGAGNLPGTQAKDAQAARRAQGVVGADGSKTVLALTQEKINEYSKLTADAAKGAKVLSVQDAMGLDLAPGDLVMVIQMQGAEIDTTDDPAKYGNVTNLNDAGKWEIATVSSVNVGANTVSIDNCGGLRNDYKTSGHSQVVRVPQYTDLTVLPTGSIVGDPWDGEKGGVIAAYVRGTTTLGGNIEASGLGFRGGAIEDMSQSDALKVVKARSTDAADGGARGEGIAGFETEYDALQGRYGRGAAANGGGGGNSHNGGGGGGGNGANAKAWSGAGVMDPLAVGAAAWKLDPDYIGNGNKLTDSSGGGRGGYTYGKNNEDGTLVGPGDTKWGANHRENVGGLGGRPVPNSPASRLFLGGGGGAGDGNSGAAGAGGAGGGLVYLVTGNLVGGVAVTGVINANGDDGARSKVGTSGNDAPGGGGAGGTVVVLSGRSLVGPTFNANGGAGGRQFVSIADESEGPGGGGGGGYVSWFAAQTVLPVRSALGGKSGSTDSTAVTEFPVNGATDGALGSINNELRFADAPTLPVCVPSDLTVTAAHTNGTVAAGQTIELTVTVGNSGPNPSDITRISDTFGLSLPLITWTCAGAGGAICPSLLGVGGIDGVATIPMGGTLTYVLTVPIPQNFRGSTLNYTASAGVAPGFNDNNPTNNSSSLALPFPGADLSVSVTSGPNPATPGLPVTYDVTVNNAGPGTAGGATLSFSIPQGGVLAGVVPGNGWTCAPTPTTVDCSYDQAIPTGMTPPVKINVVPLMSGGELTTTTTVTATGATDPNASNNSVTNTTPVNTAPGSDIAVAINSTPNPAPANSPITYAIRVSNNTMISAGGASLRFNAPMGSTVQNVMAPSGWNCQTNALVIDCAYEQAVLQGALPQINVTVQPPADATSVTATAQALGVGVADSNLGNNLASEVTPIGTAPDADLYVRVSTMPTPPQPEQPIIYTIDVANRGPGTATGAVVTFKGPQGGTVQSLVAPDGWSCASDNRQLSCWYSGDITPGGDTPDLVITVQPDPGTTQLDTETSVVPKGANETNSGDNTVTTQTSLDAFKLVGGGFALGCSAVPGATDAGLTGGVLASLLGLLGLRRRRRG